MYPRAVFKAGGTPGYKTIGSVAEPSGSLLFTAQKDLMEGF